MSENYIKTHYEDIKKYASVIENRINDEITIESVLEDNAYYLKEVQKHNLNHIIIDDEYKIEILVDKL